jgi:hypothetical protein
MGYVMVIALDDAINGKLPDGTIIATLVVDTYIKNAGGELYSSLPFSFIQSDDKDITSVARQEGTIEEGLTNVYFTPVLTGGAINIEGTVNPPTTTSTTSATTTSTTSATTTSTSASATTTSTSASATSTSASATTQPPSGGDVVAGDINLDTKVCRLQDVVLLAKYCAGKTPLDGQALKNADCDTRDNPVGATDAQKITASDLKALVDYLVGNKVQLPL